LYFTKVLVFLGIIIVILGATHLFKAAVFHRQRRNDGAYLTDKEEIFYGRGYGRVQPMYNSTTRYLLIFKKCPSRKCLNYRCLWRS